MTNRETLRSLADAVEALSGPCRETDAMIADATMERFGFDHSYAAVREEWWQGKGGKRHYQPPAYTASIDSAMSLVGSDPWVEIKGPRKYLNIPTPVPNVWSANVSHWNHEWQAMGWGATPALALTAASLRAIGEGL